VGAVGGAGGVHTFENTAGTWTHREHLTAPDGAAGDALGSAVGVSDDHEVIAGGAPHRAGDTGAVYVFR